MYELDPDSAAELDAICEADAKKGEALRACVERVCADPSGRRQPTHRYTKPFHNAKKYVEVGEGEKVWEFCPNQWRGLFMLFEEEVDGETHRLLAFSPINGKRFFNKGEAPWH